MSTINSIKSRGCSVVGCVGLHEAIGFCQKHYQRFRKYGDPLHESRAPRGGGSVGGSGYRQLNGVHDHVRIAEQALGRSLPKGTQIHHVDLGRLNNSNDNLVICPNCAYHRLLHVRTKAIDACGNANWRKCKFCHQYDDPARMYGYPGGVIFHHRACVNEYERLRKLAKE